MSIDSDDVDDDVGQWLKIWGPLSLRESLSSSGVHPSRRVRCNARGCAYDPREQVCIFNVNRKWSHL